MKGLTPLRYVCALRKPSALHQRLGTRDQKTIIDPLTEQELEILNLLSRCLSNKEITERLFIAPGTVKRHTNTVYRKLNVHSRRDAVAKAKGLGFLPSE